MKNGLFKVFFMWEGAKYDEKKEFKGDMKVYDENNNAKDKKQDEAKKTFHFSNVVEIKPEKFKDIALNEI